MRTGKPGDDHPAWVPELYSVVNLKQFVTRDPLFEIRFPPAGFVTDGTRCGLYDAIFNATLDGKIDGGKIAKDVGLKGNFWPIHRRN